MQNEDTSLQSSPQLAISEQYGGVVALSGKQIISLYKKSEQSGVPFDTLKEVYQRGYAIDFSEQTAYNRVNSFISGGAAAEMDKDLVEKRGLWDNIWAKRKRIAAGSGEHMRKPGSKGAPTAAALKASQTEEVINFMFEDKQHNLYKYNKRSGLWDHKRSVTPETKDQWLHIFKKDEPNEHFAVAKNKPKHNPMKEKIVTEAKMRKSSWDKMASALKKSPGKDLNAASQQAAQAHSELKQLHKNYQAIVDKDKAQKEEYTGAEKVSKNPNDPSNRFDGTTALTNNYKNATPGQSTTLSTIKKVVKEQLEEMSVPAGTTGKRKERNPPMVGIRMASGKIEKHPPGKSGSSGDGGN